MPNITTNWAKPNALKRWARLRCPQHQRERQKDRSADEKEKTGESLSESAAHISFDYQNSRLLKSKKNAISV